MKRLNGTEIKALFILSIVVPVGLLATFRLTGVIKEPAAIKRVTAELVTLTLPRPSEIVERINKSTQNTWISDKASIIAHIKITSYLEGAGGLPFAGHDGLTFTTYINASFEQGRINSVKINLRPLDGNAFVIADQNPWSLQPYNATLTSMYYWGTKETDAYIEANALNSPFSIRDQIFWVFLDEDGSHELHITVELTHTGRTFNEIITIPLTLRITLESTPGRKTVF